MRLIIPMVVIYAVLLSGNLFAQGYSEGNVGERKHLDHAGKPCLVTSGVSSPLVSNPRILNHVVSLENHCGERIRAKVCYYKTDECTDVTVPGNSHMQQIIGVFPAMQLFRYEVKEQF
jgi:hypothetical protein